MWLLNDTFFGYKSALADQAASMSEAAHRAILATSKPAQYSSPQSSLYQTVYPIIAKNHTVGAAPRRDSRRGGAPTERYQDITNSEL
jgi:hypothetical protein